VVGISGRLFVYLDYKVEINDLLGIKLNVLCIYINYLYEIILIFISVAGEIY
jgi:hypothetical protein